MAAMKAPRGPLGSTGSEDPGDDRVATLYARAWMFYDNNRWIVYGSAVVVVLVALGMVGWFYVQGQRSAEAEERLAGIVQSYEGGDYETALEGTDDRMGLRDIAETYPRTDAGNLAAFYAGDALFSLSNKEEALSYFERVPEQRSLVGASAVAGRAAVYEDQGDYERAADLYTRAASLFESAYTTPKYLMGAARAHEQAGNYDQAISHYNEIQERYPQFAQNENVELHVARAEAQRDQAGQANS